MAEDTTELIQSFIRKLEWRARRRQAGAYGFLGLMALGIGAAAYVFVQAKQITDRETTSSITRNISHIKQLKSEADSKYNETLNELDLPLKKLLLELPATNKEDCNKIQRMNYKVHLLQDDDGNIIRVLSKSETVKRMIVHSPNKEYSYDCISVTLASSNPLTSSNPPNGPGSIPLNTNEQFIFNIQQLEKVRLEDWDTTKLNTIVKAGHNFMRQKALYDKALGNLEEQITLKEIAPLIGEPENQNSTLSLPFLLQLNITRFGTITLVVIALGIIAPLYRFSARLAAFYRSRADIFRLHQISGYKRIGIEQLSPIFTPTFDFGKSQTMPDNLAELIRAMLAHGKGSE